MKRCTPECAAAIVRLLSQNDVNLTLGHELLQKKHEPVHTTEEPRSKEKRRRTGKVTLEMARFLHDRRELPMSELLDAMETELGVRLSSGTVYKVWQNPRP